MTRILTINEAAKLLRVHPTTIYRLLKAGKIPAFQVGSNWRFNEKMLLDWMEHQSMTLVRSPLLRRVR